MRYEETTFGNESVVENEEEITMTWKENVRKVEPYVPGEQPKDSNIIKLNTNENPYPPSKKVDEVLKRVQEDSLRRYPDPNATLLVSALAKRYQVAEENVFVGVGSDDVLGMAFLTFFNSNRPILFPDVSYSFYSVWADLYRIPYERPALDEAFRIVPSDYYKENGGIIIPNPNAPTAIYENLNVFEDILQHNKDSVVIIDEAYIDFAEAPSAVSLIDKYDNLLVVQTYSKSRSMAGMRIGYAIGNKELIQCLNDIKFSYNSYTMNQTAIDSGVAALEDEVYFKETVQKIIQTREDTKNKLTQLGFQVTDSKANFVFASHPEIPAKEIFEELKKKGIYVRYFNLPRINNYLRITIGTEEEMKQLIDFLKDYTSKRG